jgi:hypothetical protein
MTIAMRGCHPEQSEGSTFLDSIKMFNPDSFDLILQVTSPPRTIPCSKKTTTTCTY